ncbi:MAG: Arylsulfatase precursor [Verrucomicrobiota bacterium]
MRFPGWLAWCLVLIASLAPERRLDATPPPRLTPRPPNLLLIIADDQAWTDHGHMGHPVVRTPHLDRLASQSRVFTRGYVPSSLCCPSLASILTGRPPHAHGITGNDPPIPSQLSGPARYASDAFRAGRDRMNARVATLPTLPRLLAQHGYRCLQTGKWWQGHFRHGGFTDGMTLGEESKSGRHGDDGLRIGRQTLQPIRDFLDDTARTGEPWMVWYAPMMPHDPHTPPERILARYLPLAPSVHVARYWAMIEWFDETCGEILGELDRRGLADNTVVAFVTDNGWIQSPDSPRFAPRSKQSPYDGGLRTPIMVRWPGHARPGRIDHPVSSLDLYPTLLRCAGIEPPPGHQGIDLLDPRAVQRRKEVHGACFLHDIPDLEHPENGLRWRWIVRDGWKLIVPDPVNEPGERPQLFRVSRDPHEARDLAAAEPRRVRSMTARLDAWWPGPRR